MSLISNISPVIIVVGTRPEGIKMIPVYKALRDADLPVLLCSTMQHDELLSQVLDLFEVKPDFDLQIMRQGQDLFYLTQAILQKTKNVFKEVKPSIVLVQGDTTSTMAAALSAFYLQIPVGHIEAGLRTDDIHSPFPEEMNRRVVGSIANFHFAPTAQAAAQLISEGVSKKKVFCTGNTVVDALRLVKNNINSGLISVDEKLKSVVHKCKDENKKIILLTVHRRESFNGNVVRILETVKQFLQEHQDVFCFYPFHPNPKVVSAIENVGLSSLQNIYMTEPVNYSNLAHLLFNVDVVVTDSGGIQEEAVSIGKTVLVLREKTERSEGVWVGIAKMVGSDEKKIKEALDSALYCNLAKKNVELPIYGDGYAAEKIVQIVKKNIKTKKSVIKSEKVVSNIETSKGVSRVKKVSVVGLGYIGLPTSIVVAEAGFQVCGFDIDKSRVDAINDGDPVIQEPEIFEKLQIVIGSGNFYAKTKLESSDYFVIAVPTPFKENKKADLSYIFSAADSISKLLQRGNTVLLESTVPVGTTELIAKYLQEMTGMVPGSDFFIAYCPERVLPGKIFNELVNNSRVIGGFDELSVQKAKELYQSFVVGDLYLTDCKTAEMVKLVENSSRDTEIAFAHQVASMAYSIGLDPYDVIELANKHPRVNILNPSCGVGGHCIAVDPWFLIESFPKNSDLLKSARNVNDGKPHEIISFIKSAAKKWNEENKKKCTVLALGLTYKSNVDDLRESPALEIAKELMSDDSFNLFVSEPHVNKKRLGKIFTNCLVSVQDGISKADIIVYLVGHKRFRAIDVKLLKNKIVLDFCGLGHREKKRDEKKEFLFWPAMSALVKYGVSQTKDLEDLSKEEGL